MSRILTLWLPRWPVQRRLLERPALRRVPVFVCRREQRGVMKVVSWAWAAPPRMPRGVSWGTPRPVGLAGHARLPGQPAGGDAAAVQIHEGMSLAEAMAVLAGVFGSRACHVAEVDHDDPAADHAALEDLARSCRRFAPIVAIEQPAVAASRPECLHIDVTGTADFFGGEGPLIRTAVWTLAVRGIHARAAIADTPAAAWAAARHTDTPAVEAAPVHRQPRGARHRRWAIVPPGGQLRALESLPAAALGLGADVLAQLEGVGVATIGGISRLPRKSLASRFDPQLSRRLALFTGERAEPLAATCSSELPTATHAFDFPLALRDATTIDLSTVLERLVGECIGPLVAVGKGVTALQVRLDRGQFVRPGEPSAPLVFDVGTFRPTVCAGHVVELALLRMARLRLPREIAAVTVDVVSAAQADCRQRTLFGEPAEASAAQVTMLLDRLAGRLGRRAVFEPRPLADAQPEHAWAAVPPMTTARAATGRQTAGRAGGATAGDEIRRLSSSAARRSGRSPRHDGGLAVLATAPHRRPVWILPLPVRLESVVVAATVEPCDVGQSVVVRPPAGFRLQGRVREVVKAHGPERIETAWWRGPTVRRDYYVVETSDGGRYWIFRRLGRPTGGSGRRGAGRAGAGPAGAGREDGDWFLHGMFS